MSVTPYLYKIAGQVQNADRDRNQGDFSNEGDFVVKEKHQCFTGPVRKVMNWHY